MGATALPLILQPEALAARSGDGDLLIVDLGKAEDYAVGHVPGAVHLDFALLNASRPPVGGLLPDDAALSGVLSDIGLHRGMHVIAYDGGGGGEASRLLWTLDVLGHTGISLLDGGLDAWKAAGLPLTSEPAMPVRSDYRARAGEGGRADKAYILSRLGAPDFVLVDARTPAEFRGEDRRAERGGHIPGAVNFNWTDAMDPEARRLRSRERLLEDLSDLGVTPDREVVTYCQTHRRSSHTYVVLKSLGFERVRGYPGSWSDWGNDPSTPVE
ncbi:MAG: sulfurtransferase [Gammaproteobacteria bacterium]|nr:sulfurtransferase [Gammaproteobacteria bacterium]